MRTVNIHDAKTNLSKLIERAVNGESFIIAKAGKPLVKVTRITADDGPKSRIGFLKDGAPAPADFDELGRDEIAAMFDGSR